MCCGHGSIGERFVGVFADCFEIDILVLGDVVGHLRGAVVDALLLGLVRFLH